MWTLGIKSGQHVRIDVRYKHRDGNSEEKKKEMLETRTAINEMS